jgi:hypothetical protein
MTTMRSPTNDDEVAHARILYGHAVSRAHMSGGDSAQKKLWQQIAKQWLARAEALERQQRGAETPARKPLLIATVARDASEPVRRAKRSTG